MVTRLACIAQRSVSSKRWTRYCSEASWSARMAVDWKRRSLWKSWAISRTRRWKGSFLMSNSPVFWNLRMSRRATVPGRYLRGRLRCPLGWAVLRAALVASCLRGALPPVDFRAVCFVRAITYGIQVRSWVVFGCRCSFRGSRCVTSMLAHPARNIQCTPFFHALWLF